LRQFAVLTAPSSNRVYRKSATQLASAELGVIAPALHSELRVVGVATFGGVEYLRFEAPDLDEHDRVVISNLSTAFAVFEIAADGASLAPVDVTRLEAFGSDLITIQRYAGKTNEQFTHLLVNVAVAVSRAARERSGVGLPVRLIDPVAGRGTTLNRGLTYGFDVAGVDTDSSDFDAYRTFLTTYLKDTRHAFKMEEATVRKGPQAGSRRFTIRIGKTQRVDFIRDDTVNTADHFAARSFDVLVADLPYGVHHGATAGGALARSPHDLVAASSASWRNVLRSGAGVALAWNTKTLERSALEELLESAGFTVLRPQPSFEHKVDRAITRDVVMATV
jgi:hypothetical protein